jgi:hypothetical protein
MQTDNTIQVVGCPHPFRQERVESVMLAGKTLRQIVEIGLESMDVPRSLWGCGHAYVGDQYVPQELWDQIVPEPCTVVTYRMVPQGGGGGGGKNPLRTVLTIVVIAVAMYASAGAAGWAAGAGYGATASSVIGAVAATAVSAIGMLAINALVPLSAANPGSSALANDTASGVMAQAYSVSGSRNQIAPYAPVPVLLGQHKVVPLQAGMPYTEIVNSQQYLHQLFVFCYSDAAPLGDFLLGETVWWSYNGCELEFIWGATPASKPKHFRGDYNEESVSINLKQSDWWSDRTTESAGNSVEIDIAFPQGLCQFNDRGQKQPVYVDIAAQYREHGSTDEEAWAWIAGENHSVPGRSFELPIQTATGKPYTYHFICVNAGGSLEVITWGPTDMVDMAAAFQGMRPVGSYAVTLLQCNNAGITGWQDCRTATDKGLDVSASFRTDTIWTGSTYMYISVATVTVTSGTCYLPQLEFLGTDTTPIRRTVGVYVSDTPKRYDIRVRRIAPDYNDSKIFAESWWVGIRCVDYSKQILNFEHLLQVASIRVLASEQLNGLIDDLNVEMIAKAWDWDAGQLAWVYRETNNPASMFRLVLQHPANTRACSDYDIDLVKLQEWHVFCAAKGFTYNRVHNFQAPVLQVLKDIAAAGRAAVSRPDGKWSVIIEQPRTTVIQHFTPRNSWGFKSTKVIPRSPHGFRVSFINAAEGYQADELIVYDDGYDAGNATEFEGIELPGVTNEAQAYRLTRYHLAVARTRPEEYEFFADMEHIVCTRGDLIRVAHDVTLWGLGQGRIKAVTMNLATCIALVLDEEVTMLPTKGYNLRVRLDDGSSTLIAVTTPGVYTVTHTVTVSLTTNIPQVGDLFLFGETNLESAELLVKAIEPGDNLTARILAVDYSPAVYNADTGPIPVFKPRITIPYRPRFKTPAVPEITSIYSDERAMTKTGSAYIYRMQLNIRLKGGDKVQVRYRLTTETEWEFTDYSGLTAGSTYVSNVTPAAEYEVAIRAVNTKESLASTWTETITHVVVGAINRPPAPTSLKIVNKVLTWTMANAPIDLAGYEVWGTINTTDTIDDAFKLHDGLLTAKRWNYADWSWMVAKLWIRSVDIIGLTSDPASIDNPITGFDVSANVFASYTENVDLGWSGIIEGATNVGGHLVATDASPMWEEAQMWSNMAMWGGAYRSIIYIAYLPTDHIHGAAKLAVQIAMTTGTVKRIEYCYGVTKQAWGAEQMWGSLPMWTDYSSDTWRPMPNYVETKDGEGVFIRFTTGATPQPAIDDITYYYDADDLVKSYSNVTIAAAGTRLPVDVDEFRSIAAVTATVFDDGVATAVTARCTSRGTVASGFITDGPLIKCYNAAGTAVDGYIDVRVKGVAGNISEGISILYDSTVLDDSDILIG